MKIRCAWCGCDIGQKEPLENTSTTHGMCPACEESDPLGLRPASLEDTLNGHSAPVLVVDENHRAVTLNHAMAQRLGTDAACVSGLPTGNALLCRYAEQPGGCGHTIHCQTCAIRLQVDNSLRHRRSMPLTPATQTLGAKKADLYVSTEYVDRGQAEPLVIVRLIRSTSLPDTPA